MTTWTVERIVHFDFAAGDLVRDGDVHFGFHDRLGRHYAVAFEGGFIGLIAGEDRLAWTAGPHEVFSGVPHVPAALSFPMFVDSLSDGSLVVSNFGSAQLFHVDPHAMTARVLVDGRTLGMEDMGNCVVDREGFVWVNEVTGCRVWQFDERGKVVLVLGDGSPGFSADPLPFDDVRFNWIYDIRRGPGDDIYVLDSRNFALRVIDRDSRCVRTLAGTGRPGYSGDGGDARLATFGSDPRAKYDGPISLSVDEAGNAFVGDRQNRVVRMVDRAGTISTIAGDRADRGLAPNDLGERDPLRLNLPQISSMDYRQGRLFVPTDLAENTGDLVVLTRRDRSSGDAPLS